MKRLNLKYENFIIFALVVIIIAGLFVIVYKSLGFWQKESENIENAEIPEEVEEQDLFRRNIDGVSVEEGRENPFLFAIMVENMIDARPQSGLSKANLVYEALTEAGITRFLAVYASDEEVEEIGPVRSARPYYLDWAAELSALYVHSGGSPEALSLIPKTQIYDLNEFFNYQYFVRKKTRSAPHNLYTSSESLRLALEEKFEDLEESDLESWLYKDEVSEDDRSEEQEIKIDYSTFSYRVEWKYDPEKNDYLRYQAESIAKDLDSSEIRAKNIAVMYLKTWVIDSEWRRKMDTIGSGQAVVFRDGEAVEGQWKKDCQTCRTRFFDSDDIEIEFNPGTTWIEVVPDDYEIEY